MIKAGALYFSLIISLVIALMCGTVISMAFFYRLQHQRSATYAKLHDNLESAVALALQPEATIGNLDLYEDNADSVIVDRQKWGVFKIATIKAFHLKDTLYKAFLMAPEVKDSTAIYLTDENRPVTLSGSTYLAGTVIAPASGVKKGYVNGKPYEREDLVKGKIAVSKQMLPAVDTLWITHIDSALNAKPSANGSEIAQGRSFFSAVQEVFVNDKLEDVSLSGKIIVRSSNVLTIGKTAKLNNVIVIAPAIVVESGFEGVCQLFARDSVIIRQDAVFNYPSAIGLLAAKKTVQMQPTVSLEKNVKFSGVIFTFQKERSPLQTLVQLSDNVVFNGEIYASGYFQYAKGNLIYGSVACNTFMLKLSNVLYENFLVNITVDRSRRSRYYLGAGLLNPSATKFSVLQWVN